MNPLFYIVTFAISAYILLSLVQPRPSFILLLPILILTIGIGWYLNRHIQQEHDETVKKEIKNVLEEEDAQHWLHQSFVPKTNILLKKHIKEIIFYSGIILLVFIFFWSYLVAGLSNAILGVIIGTVLYAIFVFYTLYADKWYRLFFKNIPKQYRSLQKNNWIHGYIVLLPFTYVCFTLYLAFNYTVTIIAFLFGILIFIAAYTLFFVCLYCVSYLYKEYRKDEEQKTENALKKYFKEE